VTNKKARSRNKKKKKGKKRKDLPIKKKGKARLKIKKEKRGVRRGKEQQILKKRETTQRGCAERGTKKWHTDLP